MFWLIGGELLPAALLSLTGWSFWQFGVQQFQHSDWHGFRFYDLIFPLFIFISGVTLGLQGKSLTNHAWSQRWPHYRRALTRLTLLIVLGTIYNHGWGTGIPAEPEQIRYASVLARIGIAWFATALLLWHLTPKRQLASLLLITGLLLLIYSLVQLAWPLAAADSINAVIDQMLLPGRRHRDAPFDPEGLYSQFGAVANCLLAAVVGCYWRLQDNRRRRHVIALAAIGMIGLSLLLHPLYPINKPLWTGSFVLMSTGLSMLLLLAFDGLSTARAPRLSLPLHWLGNNAILAYLGTSLIAWSYSIRSVFGGWLAALPATAQPLLHTLLLLTLQLLVLRWLYQRQWFMRI
jgi:predicted acyltransferase